MSCKNYGLLIIKLANQELHRRLNDLNASQQEAFGVLLRKADFLEKANIPTLLGDLANIYSDREISEIEYVLFLACITRTLELQQELIEAANSLGVSPAKVEEFKTFFGK